VALLLPTILRSTRIARKLRNHGSDKTLLPQHRLQQPARRSACGASSARNSSTSRKWSELRRKWAALYSQGLATAKNITLPYETPGYYHVYHLYVIETRQAKHRDPLLQFLNDAGIDAKCHYPIAIHQQEGYPWGHGARISGAIPNSERNAACCIPCRCSRVDGGASGFTLSTRYLEWEGARDEH